MIAALWFRQFSLQAYLRSHAARAGDLLGMVETTGYSGSSSLLSVSESAAELGIRPGMTVAQGRLRGADLRIIERSVRAES
ncbi:MAG: hypothetical protein VX834_01920, partial [Myxococcota bacterium]|nr:hypothetical protein [Myxococcota bacterium]